jgi:hypothetical protein
MMPYPCYILCFFVTFLSIAVPSHAQQSPWYEDLFVEGSAYYCFTPTLLESYIEPGLGFRGAFGYEHNRFRFAMESGYSHVSGTSSFIREIDFAPLVFKFGYALPLFSIVGLQADLSAGAAFSKIQRYPTAIDLAVNNVQKDRENSFITGGRLYVTATPWRFLRIHAGGGTDIIFEKDTSLFMPLIEIGLHFKPFIKEQT